MKNEKQNQYITGKQEAIYGSKAINLMDITNKRQNSLKYKQVFFSKQTMGEI